MYLLLKLAVFVAVVVAVAVAAAVALVVAMVGGLAVVVAVVGQQNMFSFDTQPERKASHRERRVGLYVFLEL